jgi:two-component system cell cycle response regulator
LESWRLTLFRGAPYSKATMSAVPPNSSDDGEKTAVLSGEQATLQKELESAKQQEGCLIIVRGTPQGHRFFLNQKEMTIGRDVTADICLADQGISRKHATVSKGDRVVLTDLKSVNGTYVNDKRVAAGESVVLVKEDMIRLGNFILKYLPAGELEIILLGNLASAAHTDAMTRIYNKGYLMEALEAEFKRAKALHTEFSVIYFDLDHFKKVNDTYGHDAGDYVLKEFTSMIKATFVRPKDVFARYGGEEFVLLLGNTGAKAAAELAEKIRGAVQQHPFIYEGKRLQITTSLGVAEITAEIEAPNTLLRTADKALYAAKTGGRNRVVVAP